MKIFKINKFGILPNICEEVEAGDFFSASEKATEKFGFKESEVCKEADADFSVECENEKEFFAIIL